MTEYCRRRIFTGEHVGGRCEGPGGCGHLLAVHIGVDHCPVCELVDLAARQAARALHEGSLSINDERAKQGMPPVEETDISAPWLRKPTVGDFVHCLRRGVPGCTVSSVETIRAGNAVDLRIPPHSTDQILLQSIEYDETRSEPGTWHWPHDEEQPAEPEPDAPAPTSITINVHGSVLSEHDLRDVIEKHLVTRAWRSPAPRRNS